MEFALRHEIAVPPACYIDHASCDRYTHFSRGVAQMEARRVWDAEAGGSSPPTPTGLTEEPRTLLRGIF